MDVPHVAGKQWYDEILIDLEPDVFYVFRVDVRQKDGDKLMRYILDGKTSEEFFIPCTRMLYKVIFYPFIKNYTKKFNSLA